MRALVLALLLTAAWLLVREAPSADTAVRPDVEIRTMLTADHSGNDNDGIIQGDVALGLPGRDGGAFSFERPGAWVQVPSFPELNPGESDFLVSAWVNLEESPGPGETYDVARKGVAFSFPGEFKLEVMDHGTIHCHVKDDGSRNAVMISSTVKVTDGNWHQIGCARTGSTWSALVDDIVRSRTVKLGSVGNTVPLSIGSKYGLEDRPSGRIDDVKLFIDAPPGSGTPEPSPEDPLDAARGSDVLAKIRELEQSPPVGWWRLDEAPTTVVER